MDTTVKKPVQTNASSVLLLIKPDNLVVVFFIIPRSFVESSSVVVIVGYTMRQWFREGTTVAPPSKSKESG
ncbi:hypothetical protein [uncultured Desulfobulbus sp.]|uniref:hypothetical protein n=1 Tax=uncultured Desulfobulbus sp. TaxID=239745 RepID=UPI0029C6E3A5|nr:hypothetical protein [uncultured Desulfobulbus sp.]